MSEDVECIHGMEFGCTICSGKDKPAPETVEYSFAAKYDGQCNICNLSIHVGQRASKTTKGRVVHEDCLS